MATDIADIGFRVDTSELADAKTKLDGLVPAAGKAEKSSTRLAQVFDNVNAAAAKLMAAANGLSAATEKLNAVANGSASAHFREAAAVNDAANANSRKAKVVSTAAAATNDATNASVKAAAAAKQEASAIDAVTAARRRAGAVPIVPREQGFVSPWGKPRPGADNDNLAQASGAFRANTGNIAAQFQDIGVTAAMGMNPLLIALQQGTQLSAVFAQSGEKLGATLRTAFMSVISPVALLTIGVVALVAAGLQLIDWIGVAQGGLNAIAVVLPEIAAYAVAAGAALALAFAPAIAASIWSITLALASGLLIAIGSLVAAIGAIPLAIGLIIADLIIFRDAWTETLGVDLIAVAKDAVNLIIGAFVGAYHDIEFLWKGFPDVIGAAAIGAANMVIRAVNAIVSGTVTGLNGVIATVNRIGAIGDRFGLGFEIDEVDASQFQFDEMANDAADRLANAVKERNTQLQDDLTFDYLGAMGGAITDAATSAADWLRQLSGGLGADAGKKKRGGGKTDAEKFDDIINGAERTIASLEAERAALGLNELEAAKLKHQTDLLNEAKQKNINLTDEQRDNLIAVAHGMAELEIATARAKEALDFSKDLARGFLNDFRSGLEQGKTLWESFADAALNAMDKIVDKLLDDVLDAIFQVSAAGSGGKGGGLFGWLGSLLGGLGGGGFTGFEMAWTAAVPGLWAKGGAFPNGIDGFSNSIVNRPTLFAFAKGAGVMGEAGAEAIMPLTRGPDGSLGVQMYSDNGRNSGSDLRAVDIDVHATIGWSRTADGNLKPFVEEVATKTTQAGITYYDQNQLAASVDRVANDPRVR